MRRLGNDGIVIRRPTPDEARPASEVMRAALMMSRISEEDWTRWGGGWQEGYTGMTAWDGERCVGNSGAFYFDTLVPGGAWLATAGVTRVGVLSTHSRRGILSALMRELLTEERAAGKVLASLRASEAQIYGRFGFGLAGEATSVLVHADRVLPIQGAAPGSCRLLAGHEVKAVVPDLYQRLSHRVGAVTRDDWMWRRILDDTIEGKKTQHVVVHTSADGVDDGYALYELSWREGQFAEIGGDCETHEFFADSVGVELALWQYLASIGLVRTLVCPNRPVDDPVRRAVRDYRGYEVKRRWDEQWLRLLDVPAALRSRTYQDGPPVAIAVTDPLFPANEGTYRITAGGVEPTTDPAELTAPIAALSAAYMGGTSWLQLLDLGQLTGSADAARQADTLFRHLPGTWCGSFF